jgi:SAM-dependent methyltransferase
MTSEQDFDKLGLLLSQQAKVVDDLHKYFLSHRARLYQSCRLFNLLERDLGDALEVGPFYGYTPFLLRPRASSYVVLEGDDPAVYPLKPLYQEHGIQAQFIDLFDSFGPSHTASHSLEFKEGSFNSVLCWETMEHFNFNPVKFVRELHRVLRPGGCAYITVPNRASFQSLAGLALGRGEDHLVDSYFTFEDYVSNGKKAFYGFHWREYSAPELHRLFSKAGFSVRRSGTFVAFQTHAKPSLARKIVRGVNRWAAGLLPRYGTHVWVVAEKSESRNPKSEARKSTAKGSGSEEDHREGRA